MKKVQVILNQEQLMLYLFFHVSIIYGFLRLLSLFMSRNKALSLASHTKEASQWILLRKIRYKGKSHVRKDKSDHYLNSKALAHIKPCKSLLPVL